MFISPQTLKFLWQCTKETVAAFGKHDLLSRSAALSYYTIFSLPPLLLVLLRTTSLFYDSTTIRQTVFGTLSDIVGEREVEQLVATINNIGLYDEEGWSLLVGAIGVLFMATTIFATIQATMNTIFNASEKSSRLPWWPYLRGRLIALALVLAIAFILLVSLTLNALLVRFTDYLSAYIPELSTALLYFLSLVLPVVVTGTFFSLMFRYLPDRQISWSTARLGAVLTTILFVVGQYAITFYIGLSNTRNLYEAAGSVMVIMVWVFYASAIFYFGAQFTAIYSEKMLSAGIVSSDE